MVQIVQTPSFVLPRDAGEERDGGIERSAAVERLERFEPDSPRLTRSVDTVPRASRSCVNNTPSHGQNNLAEVLAGFHALMCFGRVFERKHLIEDRFGMGRRHKIQHLTKLFAAADHRAEDL
jgi:hypothetical protein